MARFIPYDRVRYAIFDLDHALALGETGTNLVLLSDSGLYVLQNLAHVDIHREERWAGELKRWGYVPIDSTDPNYQAWRDLVERVEQELLTVAEIDAHVFGWDGAAWRESLRPFGPQYVFRQLTSDANLTAGVVNIDIANVGDDKRAVIMDIVFSYAGTAPGAIALYLRSGTDTYPFHVQYSPVSGTLYIWSGNLVVSAGEELFAGIFSATAGDDFNAWVLGYQFDE